MRFRLLPVLILAALWLGTGPSQPLRADVGGAGGTTGSSSSNALAASDFIYEFLYQDSEGEWETIRDSDLVRFFNRARCECETPLRIRIRLQNASKNKVSKPAPGSIKVGMGDPSCICGSPSDCLNSRCTLIPDSKNLGALANTELDFDTTVRALFSAGESNPDPATVCRRRDKESIYLLIDGDDSGEYPDLTDATKEMELDGQAPPVPSGLTVRAGNEALEVSWNPLSTTDVDDLQGYSVFCARGGELPPFEDVFDKAHVSKDDACKMKAARVVQQSLQTPDAGASDASPATDGAADSGGLTDAGADGATDTARDGALVGRDAGTPSTSEELGIEVNAPLVLQQLDPRFLCSDLLTSTTSTRIKGLENGIPYIVAVAAVDRKGNASIIEKAKLQYPKATRDFYRGYRGANGKAEGGYCAVGGSHDPAGGWALLLAVVGLGLSRRRARRRS